MMVAQLSTPGWALSIIATLTIIMQAPNIYNPSALMSEYQLSNKPAARLIAFCLVLINGYDLMGALQDNWAVYWYSVVSRVVAIVFFWALDKPWSSMMRYEGATLAILGFAMWFA